MKKTLVLCFVLLIGLCGCSKKGDDAGLGKDSPAFLLAQELTPVLPALDPAKTVSLVVSRNFKITTVEVIQFLQTSLGNRIQELKALDAQQLKDVVERSAVQMAERKLLINAANDAKTVVPPEELDAALNYQYSRAGGQEVFQKALSDNGLNLEKFKENIRIDLVIQNYLSVLLDREIAVTDEEAVPRRQIVSDAKCETCHENLALHGSNRHNASGYCQICHNPLADDSPYREEEDMPARTIDFKMLIHRIHMGEELENDYTQIGYRGTAHNFNHVVYPGDLRNCAKCHVDDSWMEAKGNLETITHCV